MNSLITKKTERRGFRFPDWLREEWVWQSLLFVLVAPVVVISFLSLGSGVIV